MGETFGPFSTATQLQFALSHNDIPIRQGKVVRPVLIHVNVLSEFAQHVLLLQWGPGQRVGGGPGHVPQTPTHEDKYVFVKVPIAMGMGGECHAFLECPIITFSPVSRCTLLYMAVNTSASRVSCTMQRNRTKAPLCNSPSLVAFSNGTCERTAAPIRTSRHASMCVFVFCVFVHAHHDDRTKKFVRQSAHIALIHMYKFFSFCIEYHSPQPWIPQPFRKQVLVARIKEVSLWNGSQT